MIADEILHVLADDIFAGAAKQLAENVITLENDVAVMNDRRRFLWHISPFIVEVSDGVYVDRPQAISYVIDHG